MTYSDEFGPWKVIGNLTVNNQINSFAVTPGSNLILRFTPTIDWSTWNVNYLVRSYLHYHFEYGIETINKSTNYRYYPEETPTVKHHQLIDVEDLQPLRIVVQGRRWRYYKWQNIVNFLSWDLTIEQFVSKKIK